MTSVQDIKVAIEQLAPEQRAHFRAWFEGFNARRWDQQIEQDLSSGTLDWLAEEGLADQASGRCSDWCSIAPGLTSHGLRDCRASSNPKAPASLPSRIFCCFQLLQMPIPLGSIACDVIVQAYFAGDRGWATRGFCG
jgi:hypothetical protein